jgi:hypothetical protein
MSAAPEYGACLRPVRFWRSLLLSDRYRAQAANTPRRVFQAARRGRERGQKEGVDSVHTLGFGLGRTGAELGRNADVFGKVAEIQGLECSSSPTSGTVFPQVRSFLSF